MLLFFFSSRRRHTRCLSDWSSDVCSSDLRECPIVIAASENSIKRGSIEGEHDRPFEALWPGDEYANAAPERVRGDPAFEWLSDVLPGGLNGRLDALAPGSGDSLAVENGQRHRNPSCRPVDGGNAHFTGSRWHLSGQADGDPPHFPDGHLRPLLFHLPPWGTSRLGALAV